MRFTKIPLIATLMAVALSLLIVLPTLAQVSGDRTDGRLSVGDWIDVRVADKVTDDIGGGTATSGTETVTVVSTTAASAIGDTGYDAKDTYFNGDLYVSNKEAAFNTILITAKVAGTAGTAPLALVDDATTTDEVEGPCAPATAAAVATIRNARSNTSVKAYLVDSGSEESRTVNGATVTTDIYHGIVAVWDQEESIEEQDGPCVAHGDPVAYAGSSEQTTEAQADPAYAQLSTDITDADALAAAQTRFVANFVGADNQEGWTALSAAVLPARDGDTLIITVAGVAGSISVVVDGDAPEIDDVTPASGLTKENVVNLQFTVSDDGSGIRYDGESGISGDPDLQPVNGDGDQRFDEPITVDPVEGDGTPGAQTRHNGNGSTEDIKIYFDDDGVGHLPYLEADGTTETSEPIRDATTDPPTPNDPNPAYTGVFMNFMTADESSAFGSNAWTQVSKGTEYSLDMRLVGNPFGTYYWQVTAKDRVGNSVTTDGDEDTDGKQPFKFTVDDEGPDAEQARTGVGYEGGKGEFANRSWIALNFVNETHTDIADRIDAGTVEPGDFTVGGHTVVQAVVPSETKCEEAASDGKDIKGLEEACLSAPNSRIYLQLAAELASDERPTIQLLGGAFRDAAGNNNVTDSFRAVDKIAPGISITITSSTGTTGRAAAADPDDDSFTVRVSSDEDLSRFPRLYFATIEGSAKITGTGDEQKVGNATDLMISNEPSVNTMSEVDTNTWEKKVKVSALPGTGKRIVAVIITAADEASPANPGNSAGWDGTGTAPAMGDGLTFKKLDAGGFLVEIDDELLKAVVTVRPAADPDETDPEVRETESANPYIELSFPEADEYGIPVTDDQGTTAENAPAVGDPDYDANYDPTDDDVEGIAYKVDIGDGDTLRVDSHRAVTLDALAINGEDRLAEAVEVDPWKYVLAVTGLEVGEYEITYAARDDVGNEVDEDDASADFEVLERQPYEVDLDPGWNLISFPGDPFNPAVANVLDGLKADTVLGFQRGEWVTSVKNEDGRWQGTLTDIVGGYGYWVSTTVVETIETVIPPILPTSNLPTVPIVSGWNLIGVVDPEQHDAGTMQDADDYLTSLSGRWRVAYGFETQQNRWSRLLPGTADAMANGKGYWLWNTHPGTLVP